MRKPPRARLRSVLLLTLGVGACAEQVSLRADADVAIDGAIDGAIDDAIDAAIDAGVAGRDDAASTADAGVPADSGRDLPTDGKAAVDIGPVPAPCVKATESGTCRGSITVLGAKIYYWRNFAIKPTGSGATTRPYIRRVVFVQHGSSRKAWSYYGAMADAAQQEGVLHETLILAPYFITAQDGPPAGYHVFASQGWKVGDGATNTGVSSFAIVDAIIADKLVGSGVYPNLEEIVITGHSAGGQFTQRYAIGTTVDQQSAMQQLDFRFLVLNPSSYAYIDPRRWDQQSGLPACQATSSPSYSFAFPSGTGCDTTYDEYKYGLDDIAAGHYMLGVGVAQQRASYRAREVTYVLGEADVAQTAAEDPDLDTSCEVRLQGYCRLDRGRIYLALMDQFFKPHAHSVVTVPGVGHSARAMYTAPAVRAAVLPQP